MEAVEDLLSRTIRAILHWELPYGQLSRLTSAQRNAQDCKRSQFAASVQIENARGLLITPCLRATLRNTQGCTVMRAAQSPVRTRGFGVFEVELRAAELRKHGIRIKLQEQPFQILSLLLEHPGEVVTREELREKLWPAHTFVDFDRSLNKAMTKLRAALGDSADSPRYVETIPRHG